MKILQKIAAATIFALAALSANAIPGVTSAIPDSSGEFVYWRDNSFERESYIGLIYYDEATYGMRYYAPAIKKKPELSFLVLLTIDTEKTGVVEFTGEKVTPLPRSEDETAIINYLHDFVYELFPRRQKAGDISEITEISGEYAQFGGRVKLTYDPLLPVLNLRSITTSDGKTALEPITVGKLRSSDDESFTAFSGIPKKGKEKKFKFNKKLSKNKNEIGEDLPYSMTLDEQWEQKTPMLWLLGDAAMVSVANLNIPDGAENRLLRMMTLGSQKSYPDLQKFSVKRENDGSMEIKQTFYDADSGEFQTNRKLVKKASDGSTVIFELNTTAIAYSKNKAYFDGIFNSFKVN